MSHRWLELASCPGCCLPSACPARLRCHRVFCHTSQPCRNCKRIRELRLPPHLPGCKFACRNVQQAPGSCRRPSRARCALLEPEGEALLSSQPLARVGPCAEPVSLPHLAINKQSRRRRLRGARVFEKWWRLDHQKAACNFIFGAVLWLLVVRLHSSCLPPVMVKAERVLGHFFMATPLSDDSISAH